LPIFSKLFSLGIIAKSLHVLAAIQLTPILIQFVTSPLFFLTKMIGVPAEILPKDMIGAQICEYNFKGLRKGII
jgi:hypothetical protein